MRALLINITLLVVALFIALLRDTRGSLEVGKVADLAVLALEDIRMLEEDPELLFEMKDRILMTMSDGQVRFEKEGVF